MSPAATAVGGGPLSDVRVTGATHQGDRGLLRRTVRYSGRVVIRPRQGIDTVAADPQGLWTGVALGVLFLGGYGLTVLVYYLLGHQPVAQPFLTNPLARWYLVQTFTTLPVGMAGFLTCAGLAYLLARLWGGHGSLLVAVAGAVPMAGIMAVFIR